MNGNLKRNKQMRLQHCSLFWCYGFRLVLLSIVTWSGLFEVGCQESTTPPQDEGGPPKDLGLPPSPGSGDRYTKPTTDLPKKLRRTPMRMSFEEDCDYLAYYCLRAYKTGAVCGRTIYYRYQNFDNYCLLDYVNCMERYEVWQVAHMGECFNVTVLSDYLYYSHIDDHLLEQYYLVDE